MKCQRRMLRISWRQFVRNSEISALTGLPAINDVIRHRRIAVFGHIVRLQDNTSAHTAIQSHVNLSLGRLPIPPGVEDLVAYVAYGSTKSETTPARRLPTSGNRSLDVVIMDERRDGPRWLYDDDDDDDDDESAYSLHKAFIILILYSIQPVSVTDKNNVD